MTPANAIDGQPGSDGNVWHQDEGSQDTTNESGTDKMTVVSANEVPTVQPTVGTTVAKIASDGTKQRVRRCAEPTSDARSLTSKGNCSKTWRQAMGRRTATRGDIRPEQHGADDDERGDGGVDDDGGGPRDDAEQ
ncbi:unnamed protein product [Phytophthora fragariaefolia]|uniref:Unnamed protein product n=1 Tax=Phytophthora fragariaefolia TaxID=1490495 RepID=A0A9W6XCD5_9STRA|nr:unnamed protein product [Phytophthora fragariaefolia]